MSERFRAEVRKLCEERDKKTFSQLPADVKAPLYRILDKLGPTAGYIPPVAPMLDGFVIGNIKL